MKRMNPKHWYNKFLDWKIERKIKDSFKLRNDLQLNSAMNVPIEIVKGKYKGLVYQYGAVNFNDNNVQYQYSIMENEHLVYENGEVSSDFVSFGGHILMYLTRKKGYYDIITRNNGS